MLLTRLSIVVNQRLPRVRRWVILAMLLSLHGGLLADPGSDFQRIWLLVHFGLFLLWQPFVNTESELKWFATTVLGLVTLCLLYFLAGWMLVAWLAILLAMMGGKVFMQPGINHSRFYLVATFYLLTILLVWVVPVSLLQLNTMPVGTKTLVTVVLPIVLLSLVFLPYQGEQEGATQLFDFFYSLIVFQLVAVLVMGSIALMRATQNQYFDAVVLLVLIFSGGLFILAVLWGPRAGFSGLSMVFSRYLMSVGMPFEQWMHRVAQLAEVEPSSSQFLAKAMQQNAGVPWIAGAEWHAPDGNGRSGVTHGHAARFQYLELEIVFYTEMLLSPALQLHLRLLTQVVGEFYEGKRREQVLKQNAYMSAVHETGARMTHDIKNLLQSLLVLTSVVNRQSVERSGQSDSPLPRSRFDDMLSRQLPQLTKRLESTLDKLRNPTMPVQRVDMSAAEWWQDVLDRNAGGKVSFQAEGDLNAVIPSTLFETVLENCLENARNKSLLEPSLAVYAKLSAEPAGVVLEIWDTGSAIAADKVIPLFTAPMPQAKGGGWGIGLYQAQRQAAQLGYALMLASNQRGRVSFVLRPQSGEVSTN